MIPLFFQVVLQDSASKAGLRLSIPSLSTPVGGLIAGFIMSRWGMLNHLVRLGCFLMILGNALIASLEYHDSSWKHVVYLFPANLGQGIVFPSILFTNIAAFEQSRKSGWPGSAGPGMGDERGADWCCRTSGVDFDGLPVPIHGHCLGRSCRIDDHPKHTIFPTAQCIVRNTR
jgi:hypothetical protein